MVERLCVPLIHSTVERHLNFAASGVSLQRRLRAEQRFDVDAVVDGLVGLCCRHGFVLRRFKEAKSATAHEEGPIGQR